MADVGSVVVTAGPRSYPVCRIALEWFCDASGDVSVALAEDLLNGRLERVETIPSAVTAPTDNHDITLLDEHGYDVLQGLGANRDATDVECVVPLLAHVVGGVTDSYVKIALAGSYTLVVDNAGVSTSGTIVFFLSK